MNICSQVLSIALIRGYFQKHLIYTRNITVTVNGLHFFHDFDHNHLTDKNYFKRNMKIIKKDESKVR